MILYGSTTSPFVRRIRIFAHAIDFNFNNLDIFSGQGRKLLKAKNPTLKVPFLVDDDEHIYDSRIIFNYLCDKFELTKLSWQQQNTLTLIDAANDSLVQMFLLGRSGFDTSDDAMYFKIQRERIATVLTALNKQCLDNDFTQWHYPSISLYCLLDWVIYRELVDLSDYSALTNFWQQHSQRVDVKDTDPRE